MTAIDSNRILFHAIADVILCELFILFSTLCRSVCVFGFWHFFLHCYLRNSHIDWLCSTVHCSLYTVHNARTHTQHRLKLVGSIEATWIGMMTTTMPHLLIRSFIDKTFSIYISLFLLVFLLLYFFYSIAFIFFALFLSLSCVPFLLWLIFLIWLWLSLLNGILLTLDIRSGWFSGCVSVSSWQRHISLV